MAVVSPAASREKRMSRAFSTVDSQNAVPHQEEFQKCCFDRSNIKHGLYLFLFLDCAMAVVLFTTVIIHVAIQNNHSLIFILFTTVFCIGTALSVTFTWLSLRTEKAVFLWVFIGSTVATITFAVGLGIMLLLENVLLIQTKVFKNSIFGFDDTTLSGDKLLTLAIVVFTTLLVVFLTWKLTILIKFYHYVYENSAEGRIRHVRNDTRLHRRRKSTPYYDRRSSMFPELEDGNKPNDTAA